MPLSDKYFDYLNGQNITSKPSQQSSISQYSGLYPTMDAPTPEVQPGGALDFTSGLLWGGLSGLSWGLSDYLMPSDPWEEMSASERAGWILGEGGALMVPVVGPFAAMGKASQLAVKGTNKFIGKAGKTAASKAIQELSPRQARLLDLNIKRQMKKTGKSYEELRDQLYEQGIKRGLNKVAQSDDGLRWMRDLHVTGSAATEATQNLVFSATNAIQVAFKGTRRSIDPTVANKLAKEWVDELRDGKYVNDVAEWVERKLVGAADSGTRELVSKYLGMVAQDMLMMTTHGLIAGKMRALAQGEDFDTMGTLSHSAIMSFAFPAIRGIPFFKGGNDNLRNGLMAYKNSFAKTNYQAIGKRHGLDTVRNLARLLLTGGKKDLINGSSLRDAFMPGKSLVQIEEMLKGMKGKQLYSLLGQMNQRVNQELLKKWGPKYLADLVQSVPRMAVGVLAMNPWVLQKGAWNNMDGPELASHLFMAAVMTKGRGAWGRDAQRAYMADFSPYYDVLRTLNVDVSNVKKTIRFKDASNLFGNMGAPMNNHPIGKETVKIFDHHLKNAESSTQGYDPKNPDHVLVADFMNVYDIIKAHTDGKYVGRDFKSLDAKTLELIAKDLKNITLETNPDGTFRKVGDDGVAGHEEAMINLTKSAKDYSLDLYKQMLYELNKELGIGISVDENGNVLGHTMNSTKFADLDQVNTVNRIFEKLVELDPKTNKRDPSVADQVTLESLMKNNKMTAEQLNNAIHKIVGKYMDQMTKQFGLNTTYDPVDNNPIMEFIQQGQQVESANRLFRIITDQASVEGDKVITQTLDNVFKIDGKYAENIDWYRDRIKGYNKDAKEKTKEGDANEGIIDLLDTIRPLYELRKKALTVGGNGVASESTVKSKLSKEHIDPASLEALAKDWKGMFSNFNENLQQNFFPHLERMFMRRLYNGKGMDSNAIDLMGFALQKNLGIAREGKFFVPTEKAIREEMQSRDYNEKTIEEAVKGADLIETVVGKSIVVRDNFVMTDTNKKLLDTVDIGEYVKVLRGLSNKDVADLLSKVGPALDKMNTKDAGIREKMNELYTSIDSIVNTLDPTVKRKGLNNVTEAIEKAKTLVGEIEKMYSLDKGGVESDKQLKLNEILARLDKAQALVNKDNQTLKVDVFAEMTKNMELAGDSYGMDEYLRKPILEHLDNLVNSEREARNQLDNIARKLINVAAKGKAGYGIEFAEAQKIIENLTLKWNELYKGHLDKHTSTLSELIEKVNDNGSFSDVAKLLGEIDTQINRAVIFKNEYHSFNNEGLNAATSLEQGHSIHKHHKSVNEIFREYNLTDESGKVKSEIVRAMLKDPIKALRETVRKEIWKKDISLNKKYEQWRDFRRNHAVEVIMNIENSKPINTVKLEGLAEGVRAQAVFRTGVPNMSHPNTDYFRDRKFNVWHLDSQISVDIGGKLRRITLEGHTNSPSEIQLIINEAIRVPEIQKKIIQEFRGVEKELDIGMLKTMLETPQEYFFYTKVSPMNKMIFVATDKNVKILDKTYNDWYKETVSRYEKEGKKVELKMLKQLFGSLEKKASNVRHLVELKMMLPYLDTVGSRSEFENLLRAHAGEDSVKLAKVQANIYKRMFLADGGTTQRLSKNALKWMASGTGGHPDKAMRDIAREYSKQDGYVTIPMNDTKAEKIAHSLNVKENVRLKYGDLANSPIALVSEIARNGIKGLDDIKSLNNSILDGAKFASERLMKLLMTSKGMLTTDFNDSPNGAKTIIFSTGDTQMLGKGYIVYHPDIAASMPAGVDIVLGNTSAKTFSGKSMAGTEIVPVDIPSTSRNWRGNLSNATDANKMMLPLDALGISFTSKNASGVTISPSIFDFQGATTVKSAIEWMQLKKTIQSIGVEWNNMHVDGGKTAQYLHQIAMESGTTFDKGDGGITKLMLEFGAKPDDMVVQTALRRLLRNRNYKDLKLSPNKNGGEDNFITPNIEGDLSVPLYAVLGEGIAGTPSLQTVKNRISLRYGGIGINRHMSRRQMGDGAGNNIAGETFIFTNSNGADVIISYRGNKFQYDSNIENTIKANKELKLQGDQVRDLDINTFKTTQRDKNNVEAVLNELNNYAKEYDLTYFDSFRLLRGDVLHVKKGGNPKLNKIKLKTVSAQKKLNIQFGALSHAIPTIGHDKVVMRVEKILDKMDGLVEVNHHDLRAALQRDNDGDHLYTHTKLPWDVLKDFNRENGMKDDFMMLDKSETLNPEYVNIFGVGQNTKGVMVAGQDAESVGFHKYSYGLEKAKRTIGTIVGARNALSYLNRLDLQLGEQSIMKDFIGREGGERMTIDSERFQVLDRFYDIIQNSVDIHAGVHKLMQKRAILEDFIFFGKVEQSMMDRMLDMREQGTLDPVLDKYLTKGGDKFPSFFGDKFSNNPLRVEMLREVMKTLKRANMITNETWDEAGSRNPEPSELKQAYFDMRNFFSNPTGFLSTKMLRRINVERKYGTEGEGPNPAKAQAMLEQYVALFHTKDYVDFRSPKVLENLYFNLLKGKSEAILKPIFSFGNVEPSRPEDAFNYHIGSYMIKELLSKSQFWDENYRGIKVPNKERLAVYNKAGYFLRNVENFVEMVRAFEPNLSSRDLAQRLNTQMLDITSFGGDKPTQTMKESLNNGILRELLQRQHESLIGRLEYFRGEKFTNSMKVEKLINRIENTQTAIDLMDVKLAQGLVIDYNDKSSFIFKGDSKKKIKWKKKWHKPVAIYSIKGDVVTKTKPDEGKKFSLYDNSVDGIEIDYGKLNFVGYMNKKSKPIQQRDGFTYIVDTNPKQRVSLSDLEIRQARFLQEATQQYIPEHILTEGYDDFRNAARDVRSQLSHEYIKTVKIALSNRVLSRDIFALEFARQADILDKFTNEWKKFVIPEFDNPVEPLIRYLLQPQIVATGYTADSAGRFRPAYKTNKSLYKNLLRWTIESNHLEVVKSLVDDLNYASLGRDKHLDVSAWGRNNSDYYNWDKLGPEANIIKSIAKHLNVNFSSPLVIEKMRKLTKISRKKPFKAKGYEGEEVIIRKTDEKISWQEVQKDSFGREC